jgi:putative alpha-1,2-mannosidase
MRVTCTLVNPFIGTADSGDTGGGYNYNDSEITGFRLTHLSGPGCNGEGDVPILPTTGAIDDTTRTGMAQFTFPATTQANLIFKLDDSEKGDTATSFTEVTDTEVRG